MLHLSAGSVIAPEGKDQSGRASAWLAKKRPASTIRGTKDCDGNSVCHRLLAFVHRAHIQWHPEEHEESIKKTPGVSRFQFHKVSEEGVQIKVFFGI
jgi:hypothetical protein